MARAFDFAGIINTVGAPSLRFLRGRVAMVPTQLFAPSAQTVLRVRSRFPPFAKLREGRGTHLYGHACQIKSLGTRRRVFRRLTTAVAGFCVKLACSRRA